MKQFKANVGYDAKARPKNRYFPTLADANKFANSYFQRRGIVLGIQEVERKVEVPR